MSDNVRNLDEKRSQMIALRTPLGVGVAGGGGGPHDPGMEAPRHRP